VTTAASSPRPLFRRFPSWPHPQSTTRRRLSRRVPMWPHWFSALMRRLRPVSIRDPRLALFLHQAPIRPWFGRDSPRGLLPSSTPSFAPRTPASFDRWLRSAPVGSASIGPGWIAPRTPAPPPSIGPDGPACSAPVDSIGPDAPVDRPAGFDLT
jgi:hypothetical protein